MSQQPGMDGQRDIRELPEILRNDVRKINNQYQVMKTGNSRQTVKGLLGVSIFGRSRKGHEG